MARKLVNPSVVWNNTPLAIVPNSFEFTEGFGEQKVEAQSAGGNSISVVVSQDVSTALSMLKFSLYPTEENVTNARQMKANFDGNVFTASEGTFSRTFLSAVCTTDYSVMLKADGTIDLEFKSLPAA